MKLNNDDDDVKMHGMLHDYLLNYFQFHYFPNRRHVPPNTEKITSDEDENVIALRKKIFSIFPKKLKVAEHIIDELITSEQ